jgi:hypothetical protein
MNTALYLECQTAKGDTTDYEVAIRRVIDFICIDPVRRAQVSFEECVQCLVDTPVELGTDICLVCGNRWDDPNII